MDAAASAAAALLPLEPVAAADLLPLLPWPSGTEDSGPLVLAACPLLPLLELLPQLPLRVGSAF
jgi:hypothetical protein